MVSRILVGAPTLPEGFRRGAGLLRPMSGRLARWRCLLGVGVSEVPSRIEVAKLGSSMLDPYEDATWFLKAPHDHWAPATKTRMKKARHSER